MTERDASEAKLIQDILLEYSVSPNIYLIRTNVGAARTRSGGMVRFNEPGQSDFLVVVPPLGRACFLEAKKPDGSTEQTPKQVEFEQHVTSKGAVYAVVRSVKEAGDVMRAMGAKV